MASNEKDVQILRKPPVLIQTQWNLSLLEGQVFDHVIYNAYPKLETETEFEFSWSYFKAAIDYRSNDLNPLKKALGSLVTKEIVWIRPDENGKEETWGVFTYFSEVEITYKKDSFKVFISPKIGQMYYNPKVWWAINMAVQRRFTSRFTRIIYQATIRFKKKQGYPGLSSIWGLDFLRELLGVSDKKLYATFSKLNQRILKPAVQECNEVSDIHLRLIPHKEGRKITGVQFEVKPNPKYDQLQLPWTEDREELAKASENPLVQRCVEFGIGEGVAAAWLGKFGEVHLSEKLSLLDEKMRWGSITKNIGGYLFRLVTTPEDPTEKILAHQEAEKLERRAFARDAKQAEWEESERAMKAQKHRKEEARQAVQSHLDSLSNDALSAQKLAFIEVFGLDPDKTLPEIESTQREAFFDWIAERENLGNPYPAIRGKRLKAPLLKKIGL